MTQSKRWNQQPKHILEAVLWSLVSAQCVLPFTFATPCSTVFDLDGEIRRYRNCSYMDTNKDVVSIAWSYQRENSTLDIAFSGELISFGGWLGWGINPKCTIMAETSALVAFRAHNGSTILPYKLGYSLYASDHKEVPPPLKCSEIDVEYLNRSVNFVNSTATMFVTVKLKPNQTRVNQVWGQGTSVFSFIPSAPCHFSSHNVATLDVYGGIVDLGVRRKCPIANAKLKTLHGLLAGLAFCVIYPLAKVAGVVAFFHKPAAYVYYVVLFASYSVGILSFHYGVELHDHRVTRDNVSDRSLRYHANLSIAIVFFFSLQVFITLVRIYHKLTANNDEDYDGRMVYVIINAVVSYVLMILIIINVFKGVDLTEGHPAWKTAWAVLAFICLFLISSE